MPDAVDEAVDLLKIRRQELLTEVKKIETALDALRPNVKADPRSSETVADAPSVGSLRDQIREAMSEPRSYSADEVIAAVPGKSTSVRSILSRMTRDGDLVSVGRGQYQTASTASDLFGAITAADHDLEPQEVGG
jgi:cell division septum initiation protein DivIVA